MNAAVVARAVAGAAAILDQAVAAAAVPVEQPHGTVVGFVADRGRRWRVFELDRAGTLLAAYRWRSDALATASLLIPDGRFVTIDAGAPADRLLLGPRPGRDGAEALLAYAALDYAAPAEIPALADPARLPSGAGTTVLNAIAALAADAGRAALAYRGPYPTEQLFLSLLESFRYPDDAGDPLGAFVAGALRWTPAPHERRRERDGIVVQLRGRVEKVTWDGRTYYRADWQRIARHAPRRVRDTADGVACSLWMLGAPVEDHLVLAADGAVVDVVAPPATREPARAIPRDAAGAIVATVAATAVPALAPFVREAGRALALEWSAVDRDLVAIDGGAVRISHRVRSAGRERLAATTDRAGRVALGFALVAELAGLLGDMLRGRAQALLASRPPGEQEAALAMGDDPERAAAAPEIGRGIEALLADLAA